MDLTHWALLGMTAALVLSLVLFSLFSSPRSRPYRWAMRFLWAAAALTASGALGGVGLNLFNLCAVAGLGLPGYCVLSALAK
ncbi:MAG: hypothetical protein IJI53_06565 [Clostridia bacterium]|nr:hypothetical protein [Clostridia bacterium]MBR0407681.1 hypothetical protein [Clostridia bacterium]